MKIKYDKEVQILSLRLSEKPSVDSDVQDNVVVDWDADGNIVNIDIMPFSIDDFKKAEPHLKQLPA